MNVSPYDMFMAMVLPTLLPNPFHILAEVARDGDFVSARVVKDAYTVVIANRDDDSLPVPVSVEDRQ